MNTTGHRLPPQTVDIELSDENFTNFVSADSCSLSLDMQTAGKQHGLLELNTTVQTATHTIQVPVCVIRGERAGPTITMIAGVHGDEYEGTITLRRLARELNAQDVCGCLILLPSLNHSALGKGEKLFSIDAQDLNLAFTGHSAGKPSEQLAYYVCQHFIEPSELVVDLRSGGRQLQFTSGAIVQFNEDPEIQRRCEESMIAFGAPNSIRMPSSHNSNSLASRVRLMGKDYLQTVFGGGLTYRAKDLDLAYTGCQNVLRQRGMLQDDIELSSTRLLEVRDDTFYLFAEKAGIFEPVAYMGENVFKGYPLANILPLNGNSFDTEIVYSHINAQLIASHPGGYVNEGDLIAIVADEVRS